MTEAAPKIKKFYEAADFASYDTGYQILLDGRAAKTKCGAVLAASSQALAKAIVAEWNSQDEHIDLGAMPLTALMSKAIDGVALGTDEARAVIVKYLGTDLLCYRARKPQALVDRQNNIWNPYLEWFNTEFGAPLKTTSGVIAVTQSDEILLAVERSLAGISGPSALGVRTAAAISGSAVLGLALWRNVKSVEEIFAASRLDEDFQIENWGEDEEATARAAILRKEFMATAEFLSLI